MKNIFLSLIVLSLVSCNYVTYTPKTRTQQVLAKPFPLLFDRMVEFRIEQMGWPISRADFISKGKKYAEVFDSFKYLVAEFKVIDSNHMTFYFSQYIGEVEKEKATKKTELNSYRGQVKFYRENDKFIWKLKMY